MHYRCILLSVLLPVLGLSSCSPFGEARSSSPEALRPALPGGWCYVDTVAPAVRVDLKYAGSDNFVGRPIDGYTGRRAVLRREAAEGLARVSKQLADEGLGLLIWDAYRPKRALRDFRAWSASPDDRQKAEFYPHLSKEDIYRDRYIGDSSEHCWGIAVDITLVDLKTGRPLDMGGRHDLLDPSSATDCETISPQQRQNRHKLRDAMAAGGFSNYSKEWWHYYHYPLPKPLLEYDFPLDDDMQSP